MRLFVLRRFVLTALALPVVAGAATFHLALKRAEPAVNGRVATAPTALRLWFTQRTELAVTKVRLHAASGADVPLGAIVRDTVAEAPILVPVRQALAPGAYTVDWSTMARDGHPVKGSYGFTVAR